MPFAYNATANHL